MNRESLNFKINYFLTLMLLFLSLSTLVFIYYSNKLNNKIDQITTLELVFFQNKNSLISEINTLNYLLEIYELSDEEKKNNIYISLEKINKNKKFFNARYKDMSFINNLVEEIDLVRDASFEYINFKDNGMNKEAEDTLKMIDKTIAIELKGLLNRDINQLDFLNIRLSQLNKLIKLSHVSFIICLVIIMILTITHTVYLNRKFLKNLYLLNLNVALINSGKKSILNNITINSKDEIHDLANNFNTFENKVSELITKVKAGAFVLQQSAEILNTYNDNIVRKSESQKNEIELININLAQIKKTINYSNDSTLKLNKLAKKTKKITEIINLEATNLNDTIEVIFKSSEEIEKISTLIEELSFQTTILSLNSAVESTRIQKGSKSFDVISNEIHRLSTLGKRAAKDIKNLSSENKTKIDESAFYLKNTVKLIETIVIKINEISILIDDITKASESETYEIEHVVSSLKDIETLSNHTNSIAKDTLILGQKLNNESLNFLDVISFFDKEMIVLDKEDKEEDIDNILTDEEKDRILMTFQKDKNLNIEEQELEKDYYEI